MSSKVCRPPTRPGPAQAQGKPSPTVPESIRQSGRPVANRNKPPGGKGGGNRRRGYET